MRFIEVRERILCHNPLPPMQILKFCQYPEGLSSPFHRGEVFQTILVVSGMAFFQEEGLDELPCPPGTGVILPAACPFRWRMEAPTLLYQCVHGAFSLESHRDLFSLFGNGLKSMLLSEFGAERARAFGARLEEAFEGEGGHKDVLISAMTLELFAGLLDGAGRGSGSAACLHPAVAAALRVMERSLDRDISLKELSRESCLGPSRLSQLFREGFGVSPLRHFAKLRARKAMELLLSTRMSVGEIACEMGFSSVNYFSRFFKLQTGLSPQTARNRNIV